MKDDIDKDVGTDTDSTIWVVFKIKVLFWVP